MASGYHEPYEQLTQDTREMSRAIRSLMEELEAIDWYQQRIDVTSDEQLKQILIHNRDEEKEHAVATLEWIRRKDPIFDRELKKVLFSSGPIVHQEHPPAAIDPAPAPRALPESPARVLPGLTVGRMQGRDGT